MKKEKIILGTAALVVTAASTLAFKGTKRFSNKPLYYQVIDGALPDGCLQCIDRFKVTRPIGYPIIGCLVNAGTFTAVTTLYTVRTLSVGRTCFNPTHNYQTII